MAPMLIDVKSSLAVELNNQRRRWSKYALQRRGSVDVLCPTLFLCLPEVFRRFVTRVSKVFSSTGADRFNLVSGGIALSWLTQAFQ